MVESTSPSMGNSLGDDNTWGSDLNELSAGSDLLA